LEEKKETKYAELKRKEREAKGRTERVDVFINLNEKKCQNGSIYGKNT
jgi:hypothetical protein